MFNRESLRRSDLLPTAYGIGAMLIVLPLLDVFLSVWTYQPFELSWRVSLLGKLGAALLWPVIGMAVLAYAAEALEDRLAAAVVAVSSLFLGIVLSVFLALFLLDAIQLRVQIRPDLQRNFEHLTIRAVAGYAVAVLMGIWLGWSGLKAARVARSAQRTSRRNAGMLRTTGEFRDSHGVIIDSSMAKPRDRSNPTREDHHGYDT